MEPYCITVAKDMLKVDRLPRTLDEKIRTVELMVKQVKPYGCLSSTQTIATIIMMWELEGIVKKFNMDPHNYKIEPQDFSRPPYNEYDEMDRDQ